MSVRGALRVVGCLAALLVAANATISGMFALGASIHSATPALQVAAPVKLMPRRLRDIAAIQRNPASHSVAFLGDSTVIAYPTGRSVDVRLGQALSKMWAGSGEIRVQSVSSFGWTPPAFYLLQDPITAAGPDVAIVTANLTSFRDPVPLPVQIPEYAGWVAARRWYRSLVDLDLYEFGVTADRLLLYNLFVAVGIEDTWVRHREGQARLGYLRATLEDGVAARTGWGGDVEPRRLHQLRRSGRSVLPGEPPRATVARSRETLGQVMAGLDATYWVVETLRAILEEFARNDVATVLYVPPINVDHLREIGVYDGEGLARTLATLERVASETGAEFADLHDLLPDTAFRDAGYHLTYAEPYDGPALVAQSLSTYVSLAARRIAH